MIAGEDTKGGSRAARRRPSWLHLPVWWANGIVVLLTLLAYAGVHISPAIFWPLAFVGMLYLWLVLAHLGFLVYWLVFRRKRMWLSGITLLLGWNHLGDLYQFVGRDAPEDPARSVKVMSYNVRLFDLYNWSHNIRTRNRIFSLLNSEKPDILCLQEFFEVESGWFPTKDTLLGGSFPWNAIHDEYTAETRLGQHFGIATLTRFPILEKGRITFPKEPNNLCIWTDLLVNGDTLRVYNAHLASIRFGREDYHFIDQLEQGTADDSIAENSWRIVGRLKNAFVRRSAEADLIVEHMRTCPHPFVWCGDLNDTPMSYSYHALRTVMDDAFVESGSGLGRTYVGAFPSFRIDHIMHGPGIEASGFRTLPDELSDHRPVMCRVRVEG